MGQNSHDHTLNTTKTLFNHIQHIPLDTFLTWILLILNVTGLVCNCLKLIVTGRLTIHRHLKTLMLHNSAYGLLEEMLCGSLLFSWIFHYGNVQGLGTLFQMTILFCILLAFFTDVFVILARCEAVVNKSQARTNDGMYIQVRFLDKSSISYLQFYQTYLGLEIYWITSNASF